MGSTTHKDNYAKEWCNRGLQQLSWYWVTALIDSNLYMDSLMVVGQIFQRDFGL